MMLTAFARITRSCARWSTRPSNRIPLQSASRELFRLHENTHCSGSPVNGFRALTSSASLRKESSGIMSTIHKVARSGYTWGTNDLYDRARPSYPSQALTTLHASLPESSELKILEIGSGTGKFTRALLAHSSLGQSVAELRAVEPVDAMREAFEKGVKDGRVTCGEGTFEKTGLEDGWADLVVVAQAWHWCPDYEKGLAELARVVKPNGLVAFIWNLEDRDAAPWLSQLRAVYEEHMGNTPQYRSGQWRETFNTQPYLNLFHPHEEKEWEHIIPTTAEKVVERVLSKSYVAALDEEVKEKMKGELQAILKSGEGIKWIDQEAGTFEYPYLTQLVLMQRKKEGNGSGGGVEGGNGSGGTTKTAA
ncbi:hypothetical protein BOTBODRAFT_28848 [Botryobasidium botryosum FD-172 SS1]|uniref:Methyltransferase type 11 domain-containing protein n=1 Tax=Botryobasidium botryosum (strain FD-172 SS1) TaxID=930990 RepID=A0A067MS97_BOTB1|nr:hypothetical protein BOTBODRAFT_28848 [Botryobasidium botryosum FD-172 SS1]